MLIRTPWRRQPQTALGLAPYFAQRAIYVLNGSIPRALSGQTLPSGFGVPVASPDGRAFDYVPPGSAPQALTTGTKDFWADGSSFTLLFQGRTIGSSANAAFGGNEAYNPSDASNVNIFLPYAGDGKVYWRWGAGESEGTSSLSVSGLSFAQSDWWAFTVGPRGMEVWQNGVRVGSNSGTPSRTGTAGGLIAASSAGATTDLQVRGALIATFKEQLPAAFLARRDYWGIFKPQRRRVWAPSASSTQSIAGSSAMVFGAGSSALTGTGALAGTAALTFAAGSSALTGTGALAGSSALVFGEGSSTLTSSAGLAGTSALVFGAGSSALTGTGALAGSSANVFGEGSSALTGTGALAGASALVFGEGTSSLTNGTSSDLSGTASLSFGGAGELTGTGALSGSAPIIFGATLDNGEEPRRSAPGGGRRVRARINGELVVGTREEIFRLLQALAQQHAEEDEELVEEQKPTKKRIVKVGTRKIDVQPAAVSSVSVSDEVLKKFDISKTEARRVYLDEYAAHFRAIQEDDSEVERLAGELMAQRRTLAASLIGELERLKDLI